MTGKSIKINRREFLGASVAIFAIFAFSSVLLGDSNRSPKQFHFTVTSDCHMSRGANNYAKFMLPAIMANPNGPGAFLVDTGDFDPFEKVRDAVQKIIITPSKVKGKNVAWYPIPGNHDLYNTSTDPAFQTEIGEKSQTRKLVEYNKNNLKNILRWGPVYDSKLPGYENNGSKYTTYSFDYGNCHFVMLDLYYCNEIGPRGCGNFHKVTEKWLKEDLAANKKKNIFVFGHQPAILYTGANGKEPSKNDLMNFRKRKFWRILKKYNVTAYFCGHTHLYGVAVKDGVTQICNGAGALRSDTSYVMVFVDGDKITYNTYFHTGGKWKELSGNFTKK